MKHCQCWLRIVNLSDKYRLHNRWFPLSTEHFNAIHYLGIAIYKIGVLLFNLVPFIALNILASP